MVTFLTEISFAMAMLAGFGVAGGFVVIPFRGKLPFAVRLLIGDL